MNPLLKRSVHDNPILSLYAKGRRAAQGKWIYSSLFILQAKPASNAADKPASKPTSNAASKPVSKAKPASKVSAKPASRASVKPASRAGSKKPVSKVRVSNCSNSTFLMDQTFFHCIIRLKLLRKRTLPMSRKPLLKKPSLRLRVSSNL